MNPSYVKRIVVARKGVGLGRAALGRFVHGAFEELSAPCIWLRVARSNERAQRAYRALGFDELDGSESERLSAAVGRAPGGRHLIMILRAASQARSRAR